MKRSFSTPFTAWILACGLLLTGAAEARSSVPAARDFQADGRESARLQAPVMVVFGSQHCAYCDRVKREYLGPMARDRSYRGRVILREVEVDSSRAIVGFDGKRTTEAEFTRRHGVNFVPTVKVFDARGHEVADPVVGLLAPDFYFGYLEAAIEEGQRRIRAR